MEERFDFHPGDDVVEDVAEIEESGCAGKVPAVAFEIHEAECTVGESHELFEENEFMEENTSSHVGGCDACHEQETANDEALRP